MNLINHKSYFLKNKLQAFISQTVVYQGDIFNLFLVFTLIATILKK